MNDLIGLVKEFLILNKTFKSLKMNKFELELMTLLNKHSMENDSDTSDFILSKYLLSCLNAFNIAVNERENWFGRGKEAQQIKLEESQKPCPNCKEIVEICECMRNKCMDCGKPVGNITFSVCDDCWNENSRNRKVKKIEEAFDTIQHKLRTEHYFIRNDKENRDRLYAYTQLILNHMNFYSKFGECYKIRCDETNNPSEIVDRKQIVCTINYFDEELYVEVSKLIVLDLYEPKEFLNKKCNCRE